VSNPSALSAIQYEAENPAAFGEDVTTFATHRIPIIGAVDTSGLKHDKVSPDRAIQYRNDGTQWVLMTMGGSFKTKVDLTGHGTSTAGAGLTLDALETWLGFVWGNAALSAPAGTTLTGGTAAVPLTTASGTFSAGSLCRVGTLGDGRGGGQFYAIGTHAATSLNLLTALKGVPTNGDVLYSAANMYTSELPTSNAVTGLRFLLLTANMRYECHGCYPTGVTLSGLNVGGRPQVEITWAVSWWRYSTSTFPSVVASNIYNPAPVAAGSLFVQDFGTATRAVGVERDFRNFSIDYQLGMEAQEGPGGVNPWQKCIGARRTPDHVTVKWTENADANTLTPALPGLGTAQTFKHLLWTGSTTPGSAIGIYLRKIAIKNVALQMADGNINRFAIEAEADCSTTTTNDLTLSSFCLGYS
jgi:hypothetical protein